MYLGISSGHLNPHLVSATVGAKAFRGQNVRRGICVLELVTAGVRAAAVGGEGEVSVRCPRVGPRLPPPPLSPRIARYPWGRGRVGRCYPQSWSCRAHMKVTLFKY